jgi:prepilin-type N-terminal cleavage/methylation domain-containing protein
VKEMMRFFKKNKKGFSLVELIVVIAILGILAAIVVPRVAGQSEAARIAADEATLRAIQGAVAMFHAVNGRFPGANPAGVAQAPYTGAVTRPNYELLATSTFEQPTGVVHNLRNFLDLGDPAVMPVPEQSGMEFRYDPRIGRVSIVPIP